MDGPRVVVVGGGFAGAATALHLARGGAHVVLLEREAMPGNAAFAGPATEHGVDSLRALSRRP